MKTLDLFNKLEDTKLINKAKNAFNKSIIKACPEFFSIISFVTNLDGVPILRVDPTGFVHKSFNNVPSDNALVTLVRKPLQGVDTVFTYVLFDQWATSGANFIPELDENDTLYSYIRKDTLNRTFTARTWTTNGRRILLEICLDDPNKPVKAFTPQILVVKDISGVSATFNGIFSLKKNRVQPCIAPVDTADNPFHIVDYYVNTEMQDSTFTQGDSFKIRLEKTRNDTTWFTEVLSAIDTTYWDAMLVNANNSIHNGAFHGDTLYFPQAFTVFMDIGLEQMLVPNSADSGQVIVPGIVVRNHGTITRNPYLYCKVNNFYRDSMQVSVQPGIDTFYFRPCTLNQIGNFLVTQYSVLQGDVNPSNDTLRKTIVVNPVGIVEEKLEDKVRERESLIIKPNPAKNYIISSKKAILYDALGRPIKEIDKGKNEVDLNSGVYFIKKDNEIEKLVICK